MISDEIKKSRIEILCRTLAESRRDFSYATSLRKKTDRPEPEPTGTRTDQNQTDQNQTDRNRPTWTGPTRPDQSDIRGADASKKKI